jgi:ParB family transcriptional regulator, chromosome partitioning protein
MITMASVGGLKGMAKGRSDIYRVDPRELHTKKGWNGRDFDDPENKAHVEMLANSIAVIGVKEPLTVVWEDNHPVVINGECRLRAVMLAIARGIDVKTVPVQTEDRFSNDADRLFSQIARNSGKPFSQMEQAKVFKRLLDLGWQQADIASKSGISPSRVSQVLSLLTLPEPIKAMVTTGTVSAAMAQRTVATTQTPQEAVKVLKEAVTTAKAEGKTRATPKHLNGGVSTDDGEFKIFNTAAIVEVDDKTDDKADDTKHHRSHIEKLVFDALFDSDVDDQQADDKNNPVVVITMSAKNWEKVRQALKL